MFWEFLIAGAAGAAVFVLIYKAHTRQRDEAAIQELMRQTRESQKREQRRLEAMMVRPYQRTA